MLTLTVFIETPKQLSTSAESIPSHSQNSEFVLCVDWGNFSEVHAELSQRLNGWKTADGLSRSGRKRKNPANVRRRLFHRIPIFNKANKQTRDNSESREMTYRSRLAEISMNHGVREILSVSACWKFLERGCFERTSYILSLWLLMEVSKKNNLMSRKFQHIVWIRNCPLDIEFR